MHIQRSLNSNFIRAEGSAPGYPEIDLTDSVCESLTENQGQLTQESQGSPHEQASYLSGGGSGHTTVIPHPQPQHTALYTGPQLLLSCSP